jgi:hypothetical protein
LYYARIGPPVRRLGFPALYERSLAGIARPTGAGPHSPIHRVNAREGALEHKLAVETLKNS